jgi:transposase
VCKDYPAATGEAAHGHDCTPGLDRHRYRKDVFHVVGFGTDGKIAFRRKIRRLALVKTFRRLPSVVGMEACLSAHFVSWVLRQLGHRPRIIPAIYVKPFVKGQKNDYNDAEAIAEAALRPNLRVVREKTQDQLDLQALHRVRSRLVSRRTATINQIRSFLIEQGIAVRAGATALRNSLLAILENRQAENIATNAHANVSLV